MQYPLVFDSEMINKIELNSNIEKKIEAPMFYHFTVNLGEVGDIFIDCSKFGKGCVFINGFNIGRYWSRGPIEYLYVPFGFLKERNDIIVFETENVLINEIKFNDVPVFSFEK